MKVKNLMEPSKRTGSKLRWRQGCRKAGPGKADTVSLDLKKCPPQLAGLRQTSDAQGWNTQKHSELAALAWADLIWLSQASIAAKSSRCGWVAARGGKAEHRQVPLADHRGKVTLTCVIPGPTQWHAQRRCDTEESVQSRILKTGYHKVFF